MIEIRPAQPVPEEGQAYARFLETAADGAFRVLLGRGAPRVLANAFLAPGHSMSFEHAHFAHRNGRPVGMLSGFSGRQQQRFSDAPLRRAAGWRYARLACLAWAAAGLLRFMERLAPEEFYVQALAVDPDLRGQGLGTRLLALAEERARELSCTRLALDVALDNAGARRLYEREGFLEEAVSPRLWLAPQVRVARLVRELESR